MRKIALVIVAIFVLAGVLFYRTCLRPSEFVVLSTNDMHASIDNASRLATAVKMCRDTVFTLVVDAGDRWTGNAYVDLAKDRLPIIRVMNAIGYNAATLGNHEFDAGQQTLSNSVEYAEFPIVCANMQSYDSGFDNVVAKTRITTPDGVLVDFVGVVTSFANGRPDGNEVNFEGLTFENALDVAEREGGRSDGDVKILLSHMGDDRDMELAARYGGYDMIVGGHTHRLLDTVINGTVIGQTQRKLKYVGATRVKMRGRKVVGVEYENIPLAGYAQDEEIEQMVEEIEGNPALKVVVGRVAHDIDHAGLGNLQTKIIKEATSSDIGIYHKGGIRLEGLSEGDVTVKMLFDNEPFFSQVHTVEMTPAALRKLIISKYNDKVNAKESHRIDLYATTPYTIIVDESDEAYDVRFPRLAEGCYYRVAVADYVARNYKDFEARNEVRTPLLVYDLDVAYFANNSPVKVSLSPRQKIVVRKR